MKDMSDAQALIERPGGFLLISKLPINDIKLVCSVEPLRASIKKGMVKGYWLDNLLSLIHASTTLQMSVFFEAMMRDLIRYGMFVEYYDMYCVQYFVEHLEETYLSGIFCDIGHYILPDMERFRGLLYYLNKNGMAHKIAPIIKGMQKKLPDVLKSTYDFHLVCSWIEPNERSVLFDAMKETLLERISYAHDLVWLIEKLNSKERMVVLKGMQKDKLCTMIVEDSKELLKALEPHERAFALLSLESNAPNIRSSCHYLKNLLEILEVDEGVRVIQSMGTAALTALFSDEVFFELSLSLFLRDLHDAYKHAIYNEICNTLPGLIIRAHNNNNRSLSEMLMRLADTMLPADITSLRRDVESLQAEYRAAVADINTIHSPRLFKSNVCRPYIETGTVQGHRPH